MNFDGLSQEIFRRDWGVYDRVDRGDSVFKPFMHPYRVRILIVADGAISFNRSAFGLSVVLDTLRENPEFFVKFDVTRAHRQRDFYKPDEAEDPQGWARYGPHFEGFRFTQRGFSLDPFDEVWFFALNEFTSTSLAGAGLDSNELDLLARWMDKGGGILAMGDHDVIGQALCSRIPRVRSMRKWNRDHNVPLSEGPNRHDTLVPGADGAYTFDDESDDNPMRINPKFYMQSSWKPWVLRRVPHPILCGQDGIIDILPDHPHEGEVVEPEDLSLTFRFASYENHEYPGASNDGPRPEVIATAMVQPDHLETGFKGVVTSKQFGVIGAYNGHEAGVGRVVVDSSWHHWFDVNLIGRPVTQLDSLPDDITNPKTNGFITISGLSSLFRIQNYFRNVALWLAPRAAHSQMFLRLGWGVIIRYPFSERLHPIMPLYKLGDVALDAIGRRANRCMVTEWLSGISGSRIADILSPWRQLREQGINLASPPFEAIEAYAMGGATRALLELAYELDARQDSEELDEQEIALAFESGVVAGIRAFSDDFKRSLADSMQTLEQLEVILDPDIRENTQA